MPKMTGKAKLGLPYFDDLQQQVAGPLKSDQGMNTWPSFVPCKELKLEPFARMQV